MLHAARPHPFLVSVRAIMPHTAYDSNIIQVKREKESYEKPVWWMIFIHNFHILNCYLLLSIFKLCISFLFNLVYVFSEINFHEFLVIITLYKLSHIHLLFSSIKFSISILSWSFQTTSSYGGNVFLAFSFLSIL